jgi:hypothetical protein
VSYSYGGAFRSQTEFEQALLTRVAYDVEHVRPALVEGGVESVSFVGKLPRSRIFANSIRKLPYLDWIVPRLLAGNWWWGHIVLNHYVVGDYLKYSDLALTKEGAAQLRADGVVRDLFVSSAYRGFVYQGTLVVEFPSNE